MAVMGSWVKVEKGGTKMPRKPLTTKEETLTPNEGNEKLANLVKDYIFNKDREKEFKDAASAENTEIKAIMNEFKLSIFETDVGSVSLSERTTEDFIEDKLIEFLKTRNLATDIVKTKEYVDFDALESAIYHEKITGDNLKDMAECKEIKTTQVLRIKKK